MYDVLALVAILLAAMVLPIALVVPIALWEKRLVWPYLPVEDSGAGQPVTVDFDSANPYAVTVSQMGAPWPPMTSYAVHANDLALSIAFRPLGTFRDGKGRLYKVRYEFLLSPEREIVALIGCGTIASIPLNTTWLFTRLSDGRCLRTVDTKAGSEFDLSGLADEALIDRVDFVELVARHRGRIAASSTPAVAYPQTDPLGDHEQLVKQRVNRLEELGYIRFLDPQRMWWKYTLRGAVLWAAKANLRGMRREFWSDARLKRGAGKPR